jgi:hypothetical protein
LSSLDCSASVVGKSCSIEVEAGMGLTKSALEERTEAMHIDNEFNRAKGP